MTRPVQKAIFEAIEQAGAFARDGTELQNFAASGAADVETIDSDSLRVAAMANLSIALSLNALASLIAQMMQDEYDDWQARKREATQS